MRNSRSLSVLYLMAIGIGFIIALPSCKKLLDEDVYSQLSPDNLLANPKGIEPLLFSAYAYAANMQGNNSIYEIGPQEWGTDILWQTGDNVHPQILQFINFTWDPSSSFLSTTWGPSYDAIRDANTLIENIDKTDITEEQKEAYRAEARFLRAICYYKLYLFFGPVPLRTSTTQALELPRASADTLKDFIENELLAVVPKLPDPGQEVAYGRANRGAAMAFLCKFYLNTKQWKKCVDWATQVIQLHYYQLFPDYAELFKVKNEQNKELIWVRPAVADPDRVTSNSWMDVSWPPGFAKDPKTGLVFKSDWRNWPNEFRLRDDFYRSFNPKDKRKALILTEYINTEGKTVSLLNQNNTRSFKYWPDPNGTGASFGNDIPVIRYADILLCKAEALNEVQGPNMESVQLINQIRKRAGVPAVALSDFPDKKALSAHILRERGWEFYSEGKRRVDLIRMGKFIPWAKDRGIADAKPTMTVYPIPQYAMDANPKLIQNKGY